MRQRMWWFIGGLLLLLAGYWLVVSTEFHAIIHSEADLRRYAQSLGALGPVLIIALMTLAIVMSPLPSAPVALASGALYGHSWGTLYVLLGAELGAVIAFSLARVLGYDVLQRWFGGRLAVSWVGSQTSLMLLVFVSRLLPFLSFDIISYLAGLTALTFWRFALATLAGIAPASFLLAHFGSELATFEAQRIALALLLLGAITGLPWLLRRWWLRFRRGARN